MVNLYAVPAEPSTGRCFACDVVLPTEILLYAVMQYIWRRNLDVELIGYRV
jgi:hypothetical protein